MKKLAVVLSVVSALIAGQSSVVAQEDYVSAIYAACDVYGCSGAELVNVVDCETGGTWDPSVVGPNGETGLLQFNPNGEWPEAASYGPAAQIDLAARLFAAGRQDAWVCQG